MSSAEAERDLWRAEWEQITETARVLKVKNDALLGVLEAAREVREYAERWVGIEGVLSSPVYALAAALDTFDEGAGR